MSRVTGLVRDQLIAASFGAGALTDAFNVAFRIPNLLRRLFAEGAFSSAFVPILAATRATEGDEVTRGLIDAVATVLFWALLVTCAVGVVGAPVIVWLFGSGLQELDLAVLMTRWMFPYIGFMSLVALSAGILNTWKRFAVPAATPVLLNLAMITAAWQGAPLFARWGLDPILAWSLRLARRARAMSSRSAAPCSWPSTRSTPCWPRASPCPCSRPSARASASAVSQRRSACNVTIRSTSLAMAMAMPASRAAPRTRGLAWRATMNPGA